MLLVGFLFFVFFYFFVCPGLRVEDKIDQYEGLTLMAGFFIFTYFYFCFCILATHVLDLVCTK
jgi:hypothetical protein